MVACMKMHTTGKSNIEAKADRGRRGVPRKQRWTWEQKLELIARWEASGLSRVAFCRQERLCYVSRGGRAAIFDRRNISNGCHG